MKSGGPAPWPRLWRNIAVSLVLLGVAWRVLRYLLQFPIWGDEAFICLNFLDRDYLSLTRPLRFVQVAPLLFLWSELTVYRLCGGGELALRFVPLLAGLGSLLLFWRLARLTLTHLSGVLAVGILAVAYYPVRHCCEVKPYAFDLFVSLALLVAAVSWLRRPERLRWLIVLTLLVPFALGLSYPSVFVAGAVSVALLPSVWRQVDWRARGLYVAYNGLMVLTFLGVYLLAGTGQYDSTGGTENSYWAEWFPPSQPVALAKWLAVVHTGNLFAYPVGGRDGASAPTFMLCLVGLLHFGRGRRWDLLLLAIVPLGLTFIAAALHRYPYGGSARIAQHLAPAICLLAGTGAAMLLAKAARWIGEERRWGLVVCALLAAIGVAGMVRDWKKPYKTDGDHMVRVIVNDVVHQAGARDQIVVLDPMNCAGPTFEWYLRQHDDRVQWHGEVDWNRLRSGGQLWGLSFSRDNSARAAIESRLSLYAQPMILLEHQAYDLQLGQSDETLEHCEVFRWADMYGE
jgi:hypothetical protein